MYDPPTQAQRDAFTLAMREKEREYKILSDALRMEAQEIRASPVFKAQRAALVALPLGVAAYMLLVHVYPLLFVPFGLLLVALWKAQSSGGALLEMAADARRISTLFGIAAAQAQLVPYVEGFSKLPPSLADLKLDLLPSTEKMALARYQAEADDSLALPPKRSA